MDLNQIKIVDGKLFLDDTEVKGIQKINLQKGIDIYKTSLKIEMIVGSPLDELEPKNRKYEVILVIIYICVPCRSYICNDICS